ncbi:MAG: DUF4249 domain-containing protein [Bacteroidales bacterium]|nr:DUF4249 domain-containing protein [Bacteroidales bacterium]
MNRNKYILILIIFALFSACIKTYEPEIVPNDFSNYVVSGRVTSEEGFQYVSVSKTTPLNTIKVDPVSDCIVTIIDENSNTFHCEEYETGKYRVWMNKSSLKIGTSYMLDVETNDGERLVSDYMEMQSVGEIESVYYERKNIPRVFSVLPDSTKGIQFYIDLHGDKLDSKFYKIELTETWEYHVEQPMKIMYDGIQVHNYIPPDSSRMVCWRTINISNLYLFSTEYLSNNEYKKAPLTFVNNKTQRLKYLYSLYIKQFALAKEVYTYWEQLQKNNSQNGGLYVSQPFKIQGNICNLNKPEQSVLGMFYASELVTKRIFIKDVENLEIDAPKCATVMLKWGLYSITKNDLPAYLTPTYSLLTLPCVDCLRMGGTTNKPDFWPN